MRFPFIILASIVLAGCLATDPAAREARKMEKAEFREKVASLRVLDENYTSKYKCTLMAQVVGSGGLAPRSYENDIRHAVEVAKKKAVEAGGNAIHIISSQMGYSFPRQVNVLASALKCEFGKK